MVLYSELIKSKAEFHCAWLIATGDTKKLSRREILTQDLPQLCNSIIDMVPEKDKTTTTKAGLYLLSLLSYGTILIHQVQVDFLQRDVEKLKEFVKRKSFLLALAERFEREKKIEKDQRRRDRGKNGQSMSQTGSLPIISIEEVDDLVDLANLPLISEQLGINGDPRDFTMMDALPNLSQWNDADVDLARFYGSVEPFSRRNDFTMHSTFVEGNGSDEHSKEKRSAAVIHDYDDFVTPQPETRQKCRSGLIREQNVEPATLLFGEEQQFVSKVSDESIRFAQCALVDLDPNHTNFGPSKTPLPRPNPEDETLMNLDHVPPSNKDNAPPMDINNESIANVNQQTTRKPEEPLPIQLEDTDLIEVPPSQQAKFAEYLKSIASLPKDATNLPPLPDNLDLFDDSIVPPVKRLRLGEGDNEEIELLEMARRRPSSRLLTPTNQNELTELHSTLRNEVPEFEIDSQIRDVIPTRKRTKRNLPFNFGEDLEIDDAVQKVLKADCSSMVKKRSDVLVNFDKRKHNALLLMGSPQSAMYLGRTVPEEVRRMFRTTVFEDIAGSLISDSDTEDESERKEDTLKFASAYLLSPQHTIRQEELPTQHQNFDFDFTPIQQNPLIERVEGEDSEMLQTKTANRGTTPDYGLKYASANLLSTPEGRKEAAVAEEMDLDPIPISGNLKNYDFFHPNIETRQDLDLETIGADRENVRNRQKSSLGVGQRYDQLEEITNLFEPEKLDNEKELFFFSSGSLLPDNRHRVHEELLKEAEEKYPEWVDFNEFTANRTRKTATTAFTGLLLSLKNMTIRAKQEEPFGTILVQHVI